MKINKVKIIAKNVIQDEIYALKKIKSSIGNSFNQIVRTIIYEIAIVLIKSEINCTAVSLGGGEGEG